MKILILTPRFPFPENGGDVLRINNIARYLKKQGHKLVLLSFVENEYSDTVCQEKLYDTIYTVRRCNIMSMFFSIWYLIIGKPMQCGYYYSPRFISKLKEVVYKERPDKYLSHLLRMTPYLECLNLEKSSIVEMTDALSKTYNISNKAKGGIIKKYIYKIEKRLIQNYELSVINRFPTVVLVSNADIDYFHSYSVNTKSLRLHSNGVYCMEQLPPKYDPMKICFIGNMRTLQNQDAVIHFVNDIFPIILKKIPNAKFYIIGAQPSTRIRALSSDNVIVSGYVDDLYSEISDSCVSVAPVRVAAGIQNKVLVAMGCGVPVILTPLISQAINELKSGENCIIENEDYNFAQACIDIMQDRTKREYIGINGYRMVKESYSWEKMLDGYAD